jgi:ElaB/YqjD/DUF883 family membrane-anchored ribosome-binding protein
VTGHGGGKMKRVPPRTAREALQLLNKVVGEDKDRVSDIQSILKETVMDVESGVGQSGTSVGEKTRRAAEKAFEAARAGTEKVKHAAGTIDEQVHSNPWPYIGGVAVGAFLIGWLVGRKR